MIELSGIKKVYRMGGEDVEAVRGIDLAIADGEFVSVMGPSGSGKSSLMNIIGCLDHPTFGTYALAGTRVDRMREDALAAVRNKYIGFVFQTFNLLARSTAMENVELPLLYSGASGAIERARQALETVGLGHRINHRPNELSGGERQRVAIARAIVTRPSLILADEPTGNLDSRTGAGIMGLFKTLHASGVTIVMVTHEREVAQQAQRIVTIRDGLIQQA
ncbi:MAG: ABC transporter ATP-binding protein [Deltaproteobacteria bacterium]|nr:ABC transporter ATP-binding protein [Deltaproteobacteria bacterium]